MSSAINTSSSATTGTPRTDGRRKRTRAKLFDWKLLLGFIAVSALVVLSLFTGQYDIFGGDDGTLMFEAVRIPRTVSLVIAGAAMAM